MLVFRREQGDEHIHVEQRNHGRERLGVRTCRKTVDFIDRHCWRTWATRKTRHPTLKAQIGVGHTSQ